MNSENDWVVLYYDVKGKVFAACSNPTFLLMFIFVILGIGSVGLWFPVLKDVIKGESVPEFVRPSAFLAYSMPILTTIVADIILTDRESKDFRMLCFVLCLLSAGCMGWCSLINGAKVVNVVGLILVLFTLLVKTSNDDKYLPDSTVNAATGGGQVSSSDLSDGGNK